MTVASLRISLLTLGALCMAFGVIYAFTPGGFSWSLVLIGGALMMPWLIRDIGNRRCAHRRGVTAGGAVVPPWHPEYEPR